MVLADPAEDPGRGDQNEGYFRVLVAQTHLPPSSYPAKRETVYPSELITASIGHHNDQGVGADS